MSNMSTVGSKYLRYPTFHWDYLDIRWQPQAQGHYQYGACRRYYCLPGGDMSVYFSNSQFLRKRCMGRFQWLTTIPRERGSSIARGCTTRNEDLENTMQ